MHKKRFYRDIVSSELAGFDIKVGESDILFLSDQDLRDEAFRSLRKHRDEIRAFIEKNPRFQTSLEPLDYPGAGKNVPEIIRRMLNASIITGVGPMAGVAGAVAESVGRDLSEFSNEIIVENGGDIFVKTMKDRRFGVYAGNSVLSNKIGILIKAGDTPIGVCTSSGTVGPSLSFGKADAVSIISKDTTLADAAATAVANRVKTGYDIEEALNFSKTIEGVIGCVVIYQDRIGSIGAVELI